MTIGTVILILLIGGVLFMIMRKGGGCCGGGHDHSGHEHGGGCDMKHHGEHKEQVAEQKDPVCGMDVKGNSISHVHEGKTYSFCSEHCKEKFISNPADFIK